MCIPPRNRRSFAQRDCMHPYAGRMTDNSRSRERRKTIAGAHQGATRKGLADLRIQKERDVAAFLTGTPGHLLSNEDVLRIIREAQRKSRL